MMEGMGRDKQTKDSQLKLTAMVAANFAQNPSQRPTSTLQQS
jgi:hypothetical protein